jgi:hypothetical protein
MSQQNHDTVGNFVATQTVNLYFFQIFGSKIN